MKIVIIITVLIGIAVAAPDNSRAAEACSASKCSLPNCKCASTTPPGDLERDQIPQFVFFTFDDAVQPGNYDIYKDLFYNKTNPDGCPVSATFFMSHQYTDYTKVHDLYIHNQEIALHSISHEALTDYWKSISLDDLRKEFGGEKTLVAKFANIPEEALKGMRMPFLQLAGDNSFEIGKEIGLLYDCSWPSQTYRNPGIWPYTLDYKSNQDCPIGPCPEESIPGFWVVPMLDWTDQANNICSMVDACVKIPDNEDDLLQWFIDNFNVQYNGNRAPFGVYIHAGYFINTNPIRLEAYKRFIDHLQGLTDVFLVTPSQAIQWIQNPVPLGSEGMIDCPAVEDLGCESTTCALYKGDDENPLYMTFCGSTCPSVYPWLDNPTGE